MTTLATILKHLRLPLLSTFILAVLVAFWWVQQNNVNFLSQQIGTLRWQIDTLPATVAPKDKLALKKDQLTLEQGRVNAQNAIYGTLIQSLGGLFFFVTAYFTYCNIKVAEANLKVTEEKQVTERFSKAIELLGSEKIEVRLGGIYALERIAKDSPKDHWTIIEILTSFIREKTTLVEPNSKEQSAPSFQKLTSEVQAALTVIKRRDYSREQEWQRIELQNTNLRRAKLDEANFIEARLDGARLDGANLIGANLIGANLTQEQISVAITDEKTKFPNHLQAPTSLQSESPEPQKP